ncbi:MAG: hypothetical protein PHI28_11955 [Mangrovibacterium sp.]|nr:hypothetical protein [Mangrovibacterium sp.]
MVRKGKPVEIRIPLIPAINDDQIELIGRFLATLRHISKVKLLPYNTFSSFKYEALEMENTLPVAETPGHQQLSEAAGILKSFGLHVVTGKE